MLVVLMMVGVPVFFTATDSPSAKDFLRSIIPCLLFAIVVSWIFRRLFEQLCTTKQVVIVSPGEIAWSRKNRWGTRKGRLNRRDVTSVTSSRGWNGLGRLYLTARKHQFMVLEEILNEDAVRFANELKRAALL